MDKKSAEETERRRVRMKQGSSERGVMARPHGECTGKKGDENHFSSYLALKMINTMIYSLKILLPYRSFPIGLVVRMFGFHPKGRGFDRLRSTS